MFSFFNWLADFLVSVWNFVTSIFNGLILLLKLAPTALGFVTKSIMFVPSFLAAFVALTVTVSVVFLIVGRQSGG